jgi:hypothetical protein
VYEQIRTHEYSGEQPQPRCYVHNGQTDIMLMRKHLATLEDNAHQAKIQSTKNDERR